MYGKINVIVPPDNIFNQNANYLLVRPNKVIKLELQQLLADTDEDVNVFVYDENDSDLSWLMSVSQQAGVILIDIDNCDADMYPFIGLLLMHPNSCYIANDPAPWNLISRKRIFNLEGLIGYMVGTDDFDFESEEDEDEDEDE